MKNLRFLINHFIVKSSLIALLIMGIYTVISLTLVYWPNNIPSPTKKQINLPIKNTILRNIQHISMRDNSHLATYHYNSSSKVKFILLHGIAATHDNMTWLANKLYRHFDAEIITVDWRGHGLSDGEKYDVDYIGQYEDDLDDLIKNVKKKTPNARIVLVGHSMGGGVITRHLLKKIRMQPDAYILLAPNLGEGPTQRVESASENTNTNVQFNLKRMIGQIMLNIIGISSFDHLPILSFNFANELKLYSYRSVLSSQPIRPNTADLALQKVKKPLLVMVGEQDEVFDAQGYKPLITSHSSGEVILLNNESHMSLLNSEQVVSAMVKWLTEELHIKSNKEY